MRALYRKIAVLLAAVLIIPAAFPLGAKAAGNVARVGTTDYTTLEAAVSAVSSKGTIVITGDCELTSNLTVSKSFTITDDGSPHTIYLLNTDSSDAGKSGRGIQTDSSVTLTIKATAPGMLTVSGTSADGATRCAGPMFYIKSSTLMLENVLLTGADTSVNGGISYLASSGKMTLKGCTVTGNTALRGAVAYVYGTNAQLTLSGGLITGNTNTYKDGHGVIYSAQGGKIRVQGELYVYDNYKGGAKRDITVLTPSDLVLSGNLSGRVGVDYVAGDYDGGIFGTAASLSYTGASALFSDLHPEWRGQLDKSSAKLYWGLDSYSVTFGSAADDAASHSYSYTSPAVTLTLPGERWLSVGVDSGSFTVDWSAFDGVEGVLAVKNGYNYAESSSVPAAGESYRLISVRFAADKDAAALGSMLSAFTFTTDGESVDQQVRVGFSPALADGEIYLCGGVYGYESETATRPHAADLADSRSAYLASIGDRAIGAALAGHFAAEGWIGAEVRSSAWYWSSGVLAGQKLSASAGLVGSEEGAYVNWSAGEPGSGTAAYMASNGKWSASDPSELRGWFYRRDERAAVSATHSVSENTHPVLSSMKLSFDGDISVSYFFKLNTAILADGANYFTVTVGAGADALEFTSTVAEMAAIRNDEGSYGIRVPLPAKMMGAPVAIRLYNSGGELVRQYGNYTGTMSDKNYNPLFFARRVIIGSADRFNQNYSEDMVRMVKAMLCYGAASQQQFGYDTAHLVNAGYADNSAATVPADITGGVYHHEGGVTWTSASLAAESLTVMRIGFNAGGSVSAAVDGESAALSGSGGTYYIDIPVAAQDLSRVYTITVSSAEGTSSLLINADFVIRQVLSQSTDADALRTADMLYKFGQAAKKYYGYFEESHTGAEAAVAVAYSYLAKEPYTQYEQYAMTAQDRTSTSPIIGRRQLYAVPEDSTQYHMQYFDCSSFICNVYAKVYGEKAAASAFCRHSTVQNNIGYFSTANVTTYPQTASIVRSFTPSVPDSWYNASDISGYIAQWQSIAEEAKSIMQPGDVVFYYGPSKSSTSGAGHTLLWTGSGFIHCTGSDYSRTSGTYKDNYEKNGSVHFVSKDEWDYTYLMAHGAQKIIVFRPVNYLGNDISSYGSARAQLGSMGVQALGYDVSASRALYAGQGVAPGDVIRYSVIIENKKLPQNMTARRVVDVSFTAPAGITGITASGAVIDGNTARWSGVAVDAGKSVTLELRGKVSAAAGTYLGEGTGTVSLSAAGESAAPLPFRSQDVFVERELTSAQTAKIKAITDSTYTLANTGASDRLGLMNAILTDINGSALSIGASEDALLSTYLIKANTSSGSAYYTVRSTDKTDFPQLVDNFIGGKRVYIESNRDGDFSYEARLRYLEAANLKLGDVIVIYRGETYCYYLYLGGDNMLRISSTGVTTVESADAVCQEAYGRWFYIVLRPLVR